MSFLDSATISNNLTGDLDLCLLDFYRSHTVKSNKQKLFKNNFLALANKPTHVASKSISATDQINTNFL